jgi:hypothetical protein
MSRALKEIIIMTANYYNRTLSPQVLEMYVEDLSGHDDLAIINAYKAYRRDPKNKTFPLPAQILEIVSPQLSKETQAQEIASRIVHAIPKFGYNGFAQMAEYVGPIGVEVVRSFGGWAYICENHGAALDPGQFFAQARDKVKAKLEIQASGVSEAQLLGNTPRPELPEPQKQIEPPEFTEQEQAKMLEMFQGKPVSELRGFIEAVARAKSLKEKDL